MSAPSMPSWLANLDDLLRGKRTTRDKIAEGMVLPWQVHVPLVFLLGGAYGACAGCFALVRTWGGPNAADGVKQLFAAVVKLPALFILTLIVTFPSLYVFNALVGARLGFRATLELLLASLVVTLAVAASLGPILVFFTLSTESYAFMVLLNVVLLAIAGIVGLAFLLKTLRKIADAAAMAGDVEGASGDTIFRVWIIIYGLVGVQMAWILRPFIGHPAAPFGLFRDRQGSFFMGVVENLRQLVN